jgi:hypothetical protein|tara:strand:+ start:531 stop:1682 length:1152 start_codon:yes stop_codon:yes gene_type:complete
MANTLTDLQPDLYQALDTVSRELVGLIPAVTLDASAARGAINQTIRSFVAPAEAAADVTPGQQAPNTGDAAIGNRVITISKARGVPIRFNGEEERGLNTGAGYASILQNRFAQAMRTLTNEMEADLAGLHSQFSRAYGTAGTTPFGTSGDFTDGSNVLKVLKDNGAPQSDNQLVINTAAGASFLGKQASANIAGTDMIQRQGILLPMTGMDIRESAQILTPTSGTGASATTNAAGYAIGATVITLASAGTGTVITGDVLSFAGDTNKYVVESGDADVSNGGTITLAAPGLRVAMSTAAKAITVVAAAARNMAFNRSAIVLATRAPAMPSQGDMAEDGMMITDPRSGITFEVLLYKERRQVHYEISAAWGFNVMKPEHTALLLG